MRMINEQTIIISVPRAETEEKQDAVGIHAAKGVCEPGGTHGGLEPGSGDSILEEV